MRTIENKMRYLTLSIASAAFVSPVCCQETPSPSDRPAAGVVDMATEIDLNTRGANPQPIVEPSDPVIHLLPTPSQSLPIVEQSLPMVEVIPGTEPYVESTPFFDGSMQCDDWQDNYDLDALAADIARRVVLAHYRGAGRNSIRTRDIKVRRQGDQVHTYARVAWSLERSPRNIYHSDVFASIVMARGLRRVYRIGYKDNYKCPVSAVDDQSSPIVTQINDDFRNRDPIGMESEKLGSRLDVLPRRSCNWLLNLFSGDRDWHVGIAKDRYYGSRLK